MPDPFRVLSRLLFTFAFHELGIITFVKHVFVQQDKKAYNIDDWIMQCLIPSMSTATQEPAASNLIVVVLLAGLRPSMI